MRFHPNDREFVLAPNKIFVFGSNTAGIHGAGAAKLAVDQYGAIWGKGEGLAGNTYAIPTKKVTPLAQTLETRTLEEIATSVATFLQCARSRLDLEFFVTRIGCGLAGYTDKEIAPMFAEATANVLLPIGWENPETL